MPAIPDSTIADVRAASDLVDVVSERVRLKKQGARFIGLCPFHNEKSPSFSVDATEGLYYCFGCRRGGDVFKFVQEVEGVGFLDSVRLLAGRAGIALPEEQGSEAADRREALHAALRFAAGFYFGQLKTDAGRRGRAYLAERGFEKDAVLAFGIGVAPDAWDALVTAATAAGYKPDILEAVGLAKRRASGGGLYDVFRDRLMFPILSPIGKVLGFGGRILPGSSQVADAKYLNSPETEVYHKSEVLYGMKQAKRAIRAEREAIIVEGYADVVSLYQVGVQNVVAASGTALAATQMDLLRRLDVQRVILLFDADDAGQNAARKAIDTTLDAGLAPYAVRLPAGADPDAFVRQFGTEAFRRYLADERLDFVAFLVDRARAAGHLASPEGTTQTARDVMTAIARVQDPVLQDQLVLRAAETLRIPDARLRPLLRESLRAEPRRTSPRAPRAPARAPETAPPIDDRWGPPPDDEWAPSAGHEAVYVDDAPALPAPAARPVVLPEESELLRLMLRQGLPMVEYVLTRLSVAEFSAGPVRDVVEALVAQYQAGAVDREPFVRGAHGEAVRALVTETLAVRHSLSNENWQRRIGMVVPDRDDKPFDVAQSAIKLLRLRRIQEAIGQAMMQVDAAERDGKDTTPFQQRIVELNTVRQAIEAGEAVGGTG